MLREYLGKPFYLVSHVVYARGHGKNLTEPEAGQAISKRLLF